MIGDIFPKNYISKRQNSVTTQKSIFLISRLFDEEKNAVKFTDASRQNNIFLQREL